jgi:hypothetical protein
MPIASNKPSFLQMSGTKNLLAAMWSPLPFGGQAFQLPSAL